MDCSVVDPLVQNPAIKHVKNQFQAVQPVGSPIRTYYLLSQVLVETKQLAETCVKKASLASLGFRSCTSFYL